MKINLCRGAFTLIELLVVIAIIAILAAILFPAFARARENARRTSCSSNLKQLGISVLQYAQDYDETYPLSWTGYSDPWNVAAKPWMLNMQPYIKSTQILQCPSESEINGTVTALRPWRTQLGQLALPVSYSLNYYVGGDPDNPVGDQYGVKKLAQLVRPSEVIMMGEGGTAPPWATAGAGGGTDPKDWKKLLIGEGTAGNSTAPWSTNPGSRKYSSWLLIQSASTLFDTQAFPNYGAPVARHLETTNVLWGDGHVKAVRIEAIMKPNSAYTTPPTSCFNPARGCIGILNG